MLRRKLSSPPIRLLLSLLVLKDAGRNYYAVPGVDQVVSHKSRHFADDGHKALLGHLRHLLRVGHALVPPHRNVHSFCYLLPIPAFSEMSGLRLCTDKHDASCDSSAHLPLHYLPRCSAERTSENTHCRQL